MSQIACAQFFSKLDRDITLAYEINAALDGKESTEAANAFVWVGAKHGYEFTVEEAAAKYHEILAAEGELDDEALEYVAGGSWLALLKRWG